MRTELQAILAKLVSKVDFTTCPTSNQINTCRDRILNCSIQAFKRHRFDPGAKLDIVFVDNDGVSEGAVDEGGPSREYFRLLMKSIQQCKIFEGPEQSKMLSLDTHALDTRLYALIGKMIVVCIVHGGVGPHFFSKHLFMQLCGINTSPAVLDEVGDYSLKEKLLKIKAAETIQEANSAINEAEDSLSIMGALRLVKSMDERDALVQSALEFYTNGRTYTALTQFQHGLQSLGLLEEIRSHPHVFEDLFTNAAKPLHANDLSSLFEVCFSPAGSNRRQLENHTICFWRDWLIDVEDGECSPLTMEMVLEFASGASAVPPLGFSQRPQIQFLHSSTGNNRIYPEANTCAIILRLPLHSSYDTFKTCMTEGILQAPTFGVA